MSEKRYANLSHDRNVMKPPKRKEYADLPKTQYRIPGTRYGSPLTFGKFTPKKPGEMEIPPAGIGGRSPAGPMSLEKRVNRVVSRPETTKKPITAADLRASELRKDQEKFSW